jgi:hypothetical protein
MDHQAGILAKILDGPMLGTGTNSEGPRCASRAALLPDGLHRLPFLGIVSRAK